MDKAEEGDDAGDIGFDLVRMLAIKGKHMRRLKELRPQYVHFSNSTTFTATKSGLYRIVVKINGASSAANSDHIAIHVDGTSVARSMVGLETGHQIASHLHELVPLESGQYFQIYQAFDGKNLGLPMDNSIFVEEADPNSCRYTTSSQSTSGYKTWDKVLSEDPDVVALQNQHTFTVRKAGLYRVTLKVNGSSSGANSDHIAIHVNGSSVARAMVGLNTGHQIASHLHEYIQLETDQNVQIYQSFNSSNMKGSIDNSLSLEFLGAAKVCRYTTTTQLISGYKTWNVVLSEEKSLVSLSEGLKFTVLQSGLYRIVVKVNGTSSAGNRDHIAIHVNGTSVARSMVGLNTGHQIASHLHELVPLESGQYFQIYQAFNSYNLNGTVDNSLSIEFIQRENKFKSY